VSLCVIYKPRELGGSGQRWAAAPKVKKVTRMFFFVIKSTQLIGKEIHYVYNKPLYVSAIRPKTSSG